FLVFVAGPALVVSLMTRSDLLAAKADMTRARDALHSFDTRTASTALNDADTTLTRAVDRLGAWYSIPGRSLPVVRQNLLTAFDLANAGRKLVSAGRQGLSVLSTVPRTNGHFAIPFYNGVVDLDALTKAAGPAKRLQSDVEQAQQIITYAHRRWLLPSVKNARLDTIATLDKARHEADVAAAAASLVPRFLGSNGQRNILLGAENIAELRGRGGYIGSIGTITTSNGHITFGDFRATDQLPTMPDIAEADTPSEYKSHLNDIGALITWQNLTMSPNYPSGAQLFLKQLKKGAGIDASGLVSLDPVALSYLLEITGPVQIPGIPEPLSSSNLSDWTLNKIYAQFAKDNVQRKERLAEIAGAIWSRLISTENLDPKKVASAFGKALSQRRMVIYSTDPNEEALIRRLGIGGQVDDNRGDYLMVVGQNVGENKMDYYTTRKVDYSATLHSDGTVDSRLQITIRNTAPDGALPEYVGGARTDIDLPAGHMRTYLSAYIPANARLHSFSIDGVQSAKFETGLELGKRYVGTNVELAPGQSQRLTVSYSVPGAMKEGRYVLRMQNQATVHPDEVTVSILVPPEMVIGAREGFARGDDLNWHGPLDRDTILFGDLEIPLSRRLANRLASILQRPVVEISR
ncbi:MAG: DUF4012 domain-containing protein, partial [Actinobacteria bacterium]|nr:DUF4012 domain-containing protein [Actinomycetota bacterium]